MLNFNILMDLMVLKNINKNDLKEEFRTFKGSFCLSLQGNPERFQVEPYNDVFSYHIGFQTRTLVEPLTIVVLKEPFF